MPSESVAAEIAFWRQILAWGSVSVLLFLLLSAWTVLKRSGLDDEQKRHLKEIKNQLIDATPTKLAIHQSEDVVDYRDDVYGLLKGVDPEQATVPQRVKELKNAIAAQTPTVPRLAMRGVYEGLFLIIFAAVVQLPLWWWEQAASVEGGGLTLSGIVAAASATASVIANSPVGEYLMPVVVLVVFGVGEILYQHAIEVGLLLIAGAFVLVWADRTDRVDGELYGKLYMAAVAVVLPIAVIYPFVSVSSGKIFAVIGVIAGADPVVKLTMMVAGGAIALALKSQYPDLTNELRLAFYRALSSRAVRVFLFTRGMPFIGVAVAFLLSFPFTQDIYISLAIALVFGSLVRVLTWIWMKTAYKLVQLKDWQTPVIESVVEGVGRIEDADGKPIYIVRVDGHGLAHRDKGQLVEATLATVHRRLNENEFPPSFCHYFYGEVVERGSVDIHEVEKQLRGDVETRIEATLENKRGERMDIDSLDEEMVEEYPEPHYEQAIKALRRRGNLERRQGDYVYHG